MQKEKLSNNSVNGNRLAESKLAGLLSNAKNIRLILFIVACTLYANTIPNKWAVDDSIVVHGNKFVKRGIRGIDSLFTQETFYGFYGSNINSVEGNRWRPLSPALFALEAELFAPVQKDQAQNIERDRAGYKVKDLSEKTIFPNLLHLVNTLLFGIVCIVLYNLLLLVFNSSKKTQKTKGNFIAAFASLLFAIHPLHTEVVANVKGCDEILALLFSLLTLHVIVKQYYASLSNDNLPGKWKKLLFSSFLFFMALLSKETAITFLAIIPLTLWFFTSCKSKQIVLLTLPFVLTFLIYFSLRSAAIGTQPKVVVEELMNNPFLVLDKDALYQPITEGSEYKKLLNPNANTFKEMPFANKLATNLYTYGIYFKLLVLPYPLTSDYYPRHIIVKSFSDPLVLLSLVIHIFLLIWALSQMRKKNIIAYAILYYMCTFSIASNLFFNIGTNMSERFMFMPSVGFCIASACLLYMFLERQEKKNKKSPLNKILIASSLFFLAGCIIIISRNFNWKNNFTLLSHDIQISENSAKINMDLAAIYLSKAIEEESNAIKQAEDLELADKQSALQIARQQRDIHISKSLPLLKRALEIHPLSGVAWMTLSKAFHFLGQTSTNDPKTNYNYLKNAIAAYELADYYKSFNMDKTMHEHMSLCYLDMGKLMGEKFGDTREAIFYLEKSKTLTPEEPEVYFLLGTAYFMQGDFQKALENTQKSLALRPDDPVTKENLAVLYQQYATADNTKRDLLVTAQKLLLEVDAANKKMDDNDPRKVERMTRTAELLQTNHTLQNSGAGKSNEKK